MAKKFDAAAMQTERVYSEIAQATGKPAQQDTASPQEIKERQEALKTQGRKGAKAFRINMAFTPENHQFIKVMSKISGMTMTQFCNLCIQRYRTEHPEVYDKAKEILDSITPELFADVNTKQDEPDE